MRHLWGLETGLLLVGNFLQLHIKDSMGEILANVHSPPIAAAMTKMAMSATRIQSDRLREPRSLLANAVPLPLSESLGVSVETSKISG